MITEHQYLHLYPISEKYEKLIVGTIHPHDHENFQIPFFYGNVSSLWNILSDAFPQELEKPLDLDKIIIFLESRKIALSDTIIKCHRTTLSAFDNDLQPLELNYQLIDDIKNSNINHILFTSGFQKNSAFRLFYEKLLGLKISPEMRRSREHHLDKSILGREIRLTILISPSGSSNIGLSKSLIYLDEKEKYINSNRPIHDFKVDYYKKIFNS